MKIKILLITLGVLGLIALDWFIPFKEYLQTAVEWSQGQGSWSWVFFFLLFVGCVVFFIPISPLIMVAGTLYGYWSGFLLVSFAGIVSVALCYGLGKKLWLKRVENLRHRNPYFESIFAAISKHGAILVFLIRLNPLLPYSLLNYLFTIPKLDFRRYLLSSFLGMAPDILLYLYIGRMGGHWLDDSERLTIWNWLILGSAIATTATAILIIRHLIHKAVQSVKAEPKPFIESPA